MTPIERDKQLGLVHKLSNALIPLQSEQIIRLPTLEVEKVLMTAIQKAFKDKGQQIDPDQSDHIVNNLTKSVLKSCPYIRIAEIPIAIDNGILGDYGEYYGLNVVTFVSFIKSHYNSQKRADLAKQIKPTEEEKPIPTESEVLEQDKELLIRAFDYYTKHGYYEDHGNYMYKVAVKKLKLFELSEEKQKEFLSQGKVKALEFFKNEMILRPLERNTASKNISDAQNLTKDSDGLKKVYKEALQLALMNWFKELVEMEVEITELLTN